MTYLLSLSDAIALYNLGCIVEDRTDEEHAALCNLAVWLDEHDPQPGDKPQYLEWASDSRRFFR